MTVRRQHDMWPRHKSGHWCHSYLTICIYSLSVKIHKFLIKTCLIYALVTQQPFNNFSWNLDIRISVSYVISHLNWVVVEVIHPSRLAMHAVVFLSKLNSSHWLKPNMTCSWCQLTTENTGDSCETMSVKLTFAWFELKWYTVKSLI